MEETPIYASVEKDLQITVDELPTRPATSAQSTSIVGQSDRPPGAVEMGEQR